MIRRWLSNFIKNNINKIRDLGTKLIIVAIVVFIATIILSSFKGSNSSQKDNEETYKPTDTVIQGSDVSSEQYETDSNIVNEFLQFCNESKVEEAYKLLSDDCKAELYPTIKEFKSLYYDYIFSEEREYNLQAWISTSKYTVYKIRYTTSMLSTGIYEKDNVYEDYITLIKKAETESISLSSFIGVEKLNIETRTDEITARVLNKKVYLENEEYEIQIKNNSYKTILLADINDSDSIKLLDNSNRSYNAYINKIFTSDLVIEPGVTKTITIIFKKETNLSSIRESEYIEFSNMIKDYEEYLNNESTYTDTINLKVEV